MKIEIDALLLEGAMAWRTRDRHDEVNSGTGVGIAAVGIAFLLLVLCSLVGGCMAGWPKYKVYQQSQAGKAELSRAEFNRQIAIREAEAERESAGLKKETDVVRAEGIAEANRIIGESITPEYLRWRFIEGLHDGSGEVIYVPTEANLPILEAGRFNRRIEP